MNKKRVVSLGLIVGFVLLVSVTVLASPTCRADWGDHPWRYYPTLWWQDGPRHVGDGGKRLGKGWDPEDDGQSSWWANGDDDSGYPDDEDGVKRWSQIWEGGATVNLTITVSISTTSAISEATVANWIDFDNNGFDAADLVTATVGVGENILTRTIPSWYPTGMSLRVRTRIYGEIPEGGISPIGEAPDGEVEDDYWLFKCNAVVLNSAAAGGQPVIAVVLLIFVVGAGVAWVLFRRRRQAH